MNLLRGRIARGAAATLATRLSALGLGFIQALLLARMLGPEGYGLVAAILSLATMAAWFGVLGLNGLVVRDIARFRAGGKVGKERALLRFALPAVLVASLVAGAVALGLASRSQPDLAPWCLVLTPLIAMALLLKGCLLGMGRVALSQLALEVLRPALYVAGILAVLAMAIGMMPSLALALNAAAFLAAVLVSGSCVFALHDRRSGGKAETGKIAREALPFFLGGLFAAFQAETMTVLLAAMATPDQAGIFQVAFRLSTLLLVVRQAIDVPLMPRFAELWERGAREDAERLASLAAAAATLGAFGLWLLFVVLAEPLTGLFGKDFTAAGTALIILAGAQVLFVAVGPLPGLLSMTGHAGWMTLGLAAAQVTQVALAIVLIPDFGADGGAVSMAAGIAAWAAVMAIAVRRRLGLRVSPLRGIAILARRGLR